MEPHNNGCHVYELERGAWRKTMVWPTTTEARAEALRSLHHAELRALRGGEKEAAPEPAKPRRRRRSSLRPS